MHRGVQHDHLHGAERRHDTHRAGRLQLQEPVRVDERWSVQDAMRVPLLRPRPVRRGSRVHVGQPASILQQELQHDRDACPVLGGRDVSVGPSGFDVHDAMPVPFHDTAQV